MRFNVYWQLLGGHIHVDIFHQGHIGHLVMLADEWEAFQRAMSSVSVIEEKNHFPEDMRI